MFDSLTLIISTRHNVEHRFQGRTRGGDAAIFEIIERDALLGFDNGIDAGSVEVEILQLRAQQLNGKDGTGGFEDAA